MQPGSWVEFPPFRLDLANQELWRVSERLPLRAKPFAVLAYLATHPARLVLRAELAQAVWPDTHVGEGLLRGYVRELRTWSWETTRRPRASSRPSRAAGYRFVAPVRSDDDRGAGLAAPARAVELPAPSLVGREAELGELERRFAEASAGARRSRVRDRRGGHRQDHPGRRLRAGGRRPRRRTARGQCVEHFGAGEAYLPVLEALGRLGRLPRRRGGEGGPRPPCADRGSSRCPP